jgi:RHS repeat-associated protein
VGGRTGSGRHGRRFTGHQVESNFYFMKARFYDPQRGRFLQPDSIVPEPGNPQALNRCSGARPEPGRRFSWVAATKTAAGLAGLPVVVHGG